MEKYESPEAAGIWLPQKPHIDNLCNRLLDLASEQCEGIDREAEIEAVRNETRYVCPLGLTWDLTAAITGDVSYWINRAFDDLPTSIRGQAVMDAERLRQLHAEYLFQANLLREVFQNPFRPAALEPSCRTALIVQMAKDIYEDRAFEHLPILADALEEAGCQDQAIFGHLRGPGPHIRGCWPLDLMLGKE
jgi:hypothetical protein